MAFDPNELLNADEVRQRLKMTKKPFQELKSSGSFPAPYLMIPTEGGQGSPRWLRIDVELWIRQMAERPQEIPPPPKRGETRRNAEKRGETRISSPEAQSES